LTDTLDTLSYTTFDIYSTKENKKEIKENQAIIIEKGEWVKYSTPYEGGAEYMAICRPAFSIDLVHRDKG
jgi:ethanolamine utilization protein EutQ